MNVHLLDGFLALWFPVHTTPVHYRTGIEEGGTVITLSEQFLRGREEHLRNKRTEVARRLRDDLEMPEQHRAYKVRALIPAIERAFDRIRRGTYGSCTACGEAIPIRRLELRPEAEQCVPCAGGAT